MSDAGIREHSDPGGLKDAFDMSSAIGTEVEAVGVTVSEDRMAASLTVDSAAAPAGVDVASAMMALEAAGVVADEAAVKPLCGANGRVQTRGRAVVVVRGTPPKAGTADTLEWVIELSPMGERGEVNHVDAGTVVARVVAGDPGHEGREVTGGVIPSGTPAPQFTLGAGVRVTDAGEVVAIRAGRAVWLSGQVADVLGREVEGELRATGRAERNFAGDGWITGSVREFAGVRARGSLVVCGAAEASRVEAGEDLFVGGGVLGHEHVECVAGRDIACRFGTGTRLKAGRDVRVTGDLTGSRVTCGGRLTVGERLQGSEVVATGGVSARCVAGAGSGKIATTIEAGAMPVLGNLATERIPAIEAMLDKLSALKAAVGALAHRRDQLTPAQRMQAVRLVREMGVCERELAALSADLRPLWATFNATAAAIIEVTDVLAAGVVLRFPGMEAEVEEQIRGPVVLTPQTHEGEARVVVRSVRTGEETVIPARSVADPLAGALRRVMARLGA